MIKAPDHSDPDSCMRHEWRWFGLMSYWYASLHVVIEGWGQLRFSDTVIDRLLAHPMDLRTLLRQYRNSVFHYQSSLLNPKIMHLLRTGTVGVYWVRVLHDELIRFFADYLSDLMATEEQRSELRLAVEGLVHWYPYRHHPVTDSLERLLTRMRKMLLQYPKNHSADRRELEYSIGQIDTILREAPRSWDILRAKFLLEAGIETP